MNDIPKPGHESNRFLCIVITAGITYLAFGVAVVVTAINVVAGQVAFAAVMVVAIHMLVGKILNAKEDDQ